MAWLPDDEKFLKTCLFVFTEFTNMTSVDISVFMAHGVYLNKNFILKENVAEVCQK